MVQRQVQRPARELVTRSKLSCLAWSAQEQSQLIASDYEGIVTLWDAEVNHAARHGDLLHFPVAAGGRMLHCMRRERC